MTKEGFETQPIQPQVPKKIEGAVNEQPLTGEASNEQQSESVVDQVNGEENSGEVSEKIENREEFGTSNNQETLHEFPDLEKLYKAEEIENSGEEINFDTEIGRVDGILEDLNGRIANAQEKLQKRKDAIAAAREKLQMPDTNPDELLPEEQEIGELTRQKEKIEEHKNEVEETQELQDILDRFAKLSKQDLQIIINTGRMPNGDEVKTSKGKPVTEDVAKSIAQSAEEGATKITKAILKTVLGVVKGIIKGIFAVVKAEVK